MRILIQRVSEAKCVIDNNVFSQIGKGLMILVGIEEQDSQEDIEWLVGKATKLRIFDDEQGVMNLSLMDIKAQVMIVSQFTLEASTKKGNRPSYIKAAKPDISVPLYEAFIARMEKELGHSVATGQFGADMKISLTNDGPVTIWIDSKNKE